MSDQPPQISILDARLAEIDRRLSTIQTGLLEDETSPARVTAAHTKPAVAPDEPAAMRHESAATRAESAAVRDEPAGAVVALRELAATHARVLESLEQLIGAYERSLARIEPPAPAPPPTRFSVSAGPFPSTEALHGFERTLSRIPEVREVELRGYEGEDRAIVDVHLHDPTS